MRDFLEFLENYTEPQETVQEEKVNENEDYRDTVMDYIPDFISELETQLESDQQRWGDEWKSRPREGQEGRIFDDILRYATEYDEGTPVPWLKIAGLALIGWVREKENI